MGATGASVVRRLQPLFADPDAFIRRITETFQAREPITGEQMKAADGRTIECDYWPVLVNGRYRGDLWLAWDMSDRATLAEQRQAALDAEHSARQLAEQAQRQLTEQNERLQAQDEARNQFLSVVSHELRTPLTSIVSFSELLRGEGEGLTPDGLNFLDIIERNANRLHRLIGDLFMLNRLEIGALPLDLALVDVPQLVEDAVRNAASDAARQEVTVEIGPTWRWTCRLTATRTGCCRCSTTCCPTPSSSPTGAARSRSARPARTVTGGSTWRTPASASRRARPATCSAASSAARTRAPRRCQGPGSACPS